VADEAVFFVAHLPAETGQPEQLVDMREIEERDFPQPVGELDRRQRLLPELSAPLRLDAVGGERPRRGLEHVLIADVAMRQHVLQIVGERPQPAFLDEQHRRRGDRLIFVV